MLAFLCYIVLEFAQNQGHPPFMSPSDFHAWMPTAHHNNPRIMEFIDEFLKLDIGIVNQGNSGFVYDAGSVDKVCEPKVIVTAYGINDFMRKKLQMIEHDRVEFMKKVKSVYENSKIVSVLPLWTKWDADNEDFKKEERDCLRKIYEKDCDYVVDGRDLITHDDRYFSDGVHPNDESFKYYADGLGNRLSEII